MLWWFPNYGTHFVAMQKCYRKIVQKILSEKAGFVLKTGKLCMENTEVCPRYLCICPMEESVVASDRFLGQESYEKPSNCGGLQQWCRVEAAFAETVKTAPLRRRGGKRFV